MKILAVISAVIVMTFAMPSQSQDLDPTEQILPFNEDAEMITIGDYAEAAKALGDRGGAIQHAIARMDIDWDTIAFDDPRLSRYLTGVINLSLGYNLSCHALAGLFDNPRKLETCTEDWDKENRYFWCAVEAGNPVSDAKVDACIEDDRVADDSWTPQLQIMAQAMILEAKGRYDEAIEMYGQVGSLIPGVWHFELIFTDIRDGTTAAVRLIDDYVTARRFRLIVATSESALPNPFKWSTRIFCRADYPETCPSAFLALQDIVRYADGYRPREDDTFLTALGRPQHWLGLDAYEHPMFWAAALAHQNGDAAGVEHALSYRDELGDDVGGGVAYVLDLYAGAADFDGNIPAACATAGCRYFLAQYLYGDDRIDEGHAVVEQSSAICAGTQSVICSVLRAAEAKILAGGVP